LWGGVVGEEGLSGISLGEDGIGQAYSDFQTSIKRLSNEGVIIALSSKNNEQDVWNVFNKNTNMVLKKKDIINAKINWEEKFINIKKISKELSLGLNSFVFWDDNPIERQKVMINCPEVDVIDVPKNVYEWPNYLNRLYNFSKFYITEEDYKKKDQYKARSKFVSDQNKNRSNLNFLKKIKIRPKLLKLNKSNIKRASQLTMKTNQFNFRTKRYSETDIINTEKNKKKIIYLLHLKDIYADYGNIGMVIIELMDNNTAFLDTFLMSCRILGRNVEKWFISEIVKFCKNKKIKNIYIELIISCRNQVAKNFLNDSIFSEIKSFDFNGKLIKNKINKKKIFKIDVSKFSFNNKKMYE
jgi:FkbH-like protein